MSRPMSIFKEQDIWAIAENFKIHFCEIYYDRYYDWFDGDKIIKVMIKGLKRTGCMFCLFGIHREPKNTLNRFQRMAVTHPKQYAFMLSISPLKIAMDFFNIKYLISKKDFEENIVQGVLEFE